ncbi:MAG: hypothetical protein OJF52_001875 [Nitrospira sp.]|nr:MAG: hypothetical protein OJF52_001875 [Nitrospira sp.]
MESAELEGRQRGEFRASMGPRHLCRGIGNGFYSGLHYSEQLQWGHGISAVESTFVGMMAIAGIMLQWGHGISAVESDRIPRNSRSHSRFNGATASLPWNPCYPSAWCRSYPMLQWGHGISAVESVKSIVTKDQGVIASMGPRHLCRGIGWVNGIRQHSSCASMGPRHLCRGIPCGMCCGSP